MMASTKPGDIVLDPFFGSGTTGAVAKRLGRHFVGIEREQAYIDAATSASPRSSRSAWSLADRHDRQACRSRASPFVQLIESGLIKPGDAADDAKKRATGQGSRRRHAGERRRRRLDPSPRRQGPGLDACNGWTFWHFDDGQSLRPIDDLRPSSARSADQPHDASMPNAALLNRCAAFSCKSHRALALNMPRLQDFPVGSIRTSKQWAQ
jgi:modification methylase